MFSAMASPNMGKFDLWASEAITPFFAARPITTLRLVGNKMKASIRSAMIAWIMVLILLGSWAVLDARDTDQQKSLVCGFMAQATAKQMIGVALVVVGLLLIMWLNSAVGHDGRLLTGRKWVATVLGLLAAGCVFAAPGNRGLNFDQPAPKELALRSLPSFMGALVSLKLAAAAAVATQLLHRQLTLVEIPSPALFARAVTILLVVVTCCMIRLEPRRRAILLSTASPHRHRPIGTRLEPPSIGDSRQAEPPRTRAAPVQYNGNRFPSFGQSWSCQLWQVRTERYSDLELKLVPFSH